MARKPGIIRNNACGISAKGNKFWQRKKKMFELRRATLPRERVSGLELRHYTQRYICIYTPIYIYAYIQRGSCVHTEKYFWNLIKSTPNRIVFTIFRLI